MKNNQAQTVVEYILLMIAVIVVFLVIANPQTGPLKNSVEKTLNSTADKLGVLSTKIQYQ